MNQNINSIFTQSNELPTKLRARLCCARLCCWICSAILTLTFGAAEILADVGDWYRQIPGGRFSVDATGATYLATGSGLLDLDPGSGVQTYSTPDGGSRLVVAKYDQNLDYLWSIASEGSGSPYPAALRIDSNNSAIVCGSFNGSIDLNPASGQALHSAPIKGWNPVSGLPNPQNGFFAKYSSSGLYQWSVSYGLGSDSGATADALAIDGTDNIFVAGTFVGTVDFDPGVGTANRTATGTNSFYLAKYLPNGQFSWVISSQGTGSVSVVGLVVDSTGSLYLAGTNPGIPDFDPDVGVANIASSIYVAKYDTSGSYQWALAIAMTTITDIAIRSNGEIAITGTRFASSFPNNLWAIYLARISPGGALTNLFTFGFYENQYPSPLITADDAGNIFLTGLFSNAADLYPGASPQLQASDASDVFILKLDSSGAIVDKARFSTSDIDSVDAIAHVSGSRVLFHADGGLLSYDLDDALDSTPPPTPSVVAPTDNLHTNAISLVATGTAEPHALVTLLYAGTPSYYMLAPTDALGNWTASVQMAEGDYTLTALAADKAGNRSGASTAISVSVLRTIGDVYLTAPSSSLITTSTPTFTGVAGTNSNVTVLLNGAAVATVPVVSGEWNYQPSTPLPDMQYRIVLSADDSYGNVAYSPTYTFNLDATAPPPPTVSTPAEGAATNDETPTIQGSAEALTHVALYVDQLPPQILYIGGSGTFSTSVTSLLAAGEHSVYAVATDSSGLTSAASATRHFLVDKTPPAIPTIATLPVLAATSDTTPLFTGSAEASSTVQVFRNGTSLGTSQADQSGKWQFTPGTNLPSGAAYFQARAQDAAGNTGSFSAPIVLTIDSIAPNAPIITSPVNSSTSLTTTISVRGTAESNSTVTLYRGSSLIATVLASPSGSWISPYSAPSFGSYTFSARAQDSAGNLSSPSSSVTVNFTELLTNLDKDNDGLNYQEEIAQGTDPNNPDTDRDSFSDGQEVLDGTNPLDPGSHYRPSQSTVCSDWNGFLGGMVNVMEHLNSGSTKAKYVSTLYDAKGKAKSTGSFTLSPGVQQDRVVNAAPGFEASNYGRVCSTQVSGAAGDLDGRMVYYKLGTDGRYQFALSMPFSPGIKGRQYAQWASRQPSLDVADSLNLIANWVQVSNLETVAQRGVVVFYSAAGAIVSSKAIKIPASGRIDIPASVIPSSNGLIEWIPESPTAKFQVRNLRYYYDNPTALESFDGAINDEASVGSGQELIIPFDTRQANTWVHISNALGKLVNTRVSAYDSFGKLKASMSNKLKGHSTWNINLNLYAPRQAGILVIKGDLTASIVASLVQAKLTTGNRIQTLHAIAGAESIGAVLVGSYNTYLEQQCSLLLANSDDAEVSVSLSVVRNDSTRLVNGETLKVPAHGLKEYNLCAKDGPDHYGVVTIQPNRANTMRAIVMRVGPSESFRLPTLARQ